MKKAKLFDIKRFPMDLARLVCMPLLLIYRMKRITPEGKPYREKLRGGAILAANHTCFSDPFVAATAFWYRRAFFLVGEVVMKNPLIAFLLRGVGAIKVERGQVDIEAIKKSVNVLQNGRLLIVFPQGGIANADDMQSIKSGAAMIALQAGVPIVPMYICPKSHWYSRQQVIIGEMVDPGAICKKKMPSLADIQRITDTLMEQMQRCGQASNREGVEL